MQTRQPFVDTSVSPTIVIESRYCAPFPTGLEIVKTTNIFADKFSARNLNDNTVFTFQRHFFSVHKRCILLHHAGCPILTLHRKRMTAHKRWRVFRGTSDQMKDLLFSVKQPNIFQPNTTIELEVFLANNNEEKDYEFKVQGSWSSGYFDVYSVHSSKIVAQMGKLQTTGSDNFVVRVEADVDCAFIVALIVILSQQ